VLWAFPGWY
jgi:hypothetical protein